MIVIIIIVLLKRKIITQITNYGTQMAKILKNKFKHIQRLQKNRVMNNIMERCHTFYQFGNINFEMK